ncbi:MAG: hypothetical protein R3310_04730 [Candidatus Competibacteraceae bacterium]|nr:hypothetical protein [Candidatus Competibacteraceae bacterium]
MSDDLKNWTEAQRRLWENLSTTLPTFQPPQNLEGWRETYLRNLEVWEQSVQETLQLQASWVRQWAEQVSQDYGQSESMGEWSRQVEEVMQHWLDTQTRLWNNWFAMLRSGSEARPRVNTPRSIDQVRPHHPTTVQGESPALEKGGAGQAPTSTPKAAVRAEPAPPETTTKRSKSRRTTTRKTSTGSRSTAGRAKSTRPRSKAPAPEERPNPAQPENPQAAKSGPAPEAQAEPVVNTSQSLEKAPGKKTTDQDQENQS